MSTLFLIPNFNTSDLLGRCLSHLHATQGSYGIHVLVIDNGSSSSQRKVMHDTLSASPLDTHVIHLEENAGFGGAINAGLTWRLKNAPMAPVCLLNVDLFLLDNGWLDLWEGFLQDHPTVGVLGMGHPRFAGKGCFYDYRKSRPLKPGEAQFVNGTLMYVTPEALKAAPLIDPFYSPGYWEDADWCYEIFWAGKLDIWAYHVRCRHLEMCASKANNYRLTPAIQTAEQLRSKQTANRNYFQWKWSSLLAPRRSSYEKEVDFLVLQKKQRETATLPGPVDQRMRFLRKRMQMGPSIG